jgi:aminoglycoside 3-N-acetyltransferase
MTTPEIIAAIPTGSVLLVHASFRPLAKEGLTPSRLIELLQIQLGKEGTLVMPTFSYNYSGICDVTPYDRNTTPGLENGILSEVFRQTPGVKRSGNPTYSVAAWGKYAELLTDGSRNDAGLGFGSSYENASKLGAKILLLNVANNRNSMLHYAEIASDIPYNDIHFREAWGRTATTIDGEMKLVEKFPACSEAFGKFDKPFLAAGIAKRLGNSFLLDSIPMVEYIVKEIRRQPDIMLCDDQACEPCTLRRKRLREKGLIK